MFFITYIILMSIGKLIQKTLAAIWPFFYTIFLLLSIWAAYKSIIWIALWFLKQRLRKKNLEGFKQILGNNYQAKSLGEGDKRYKWNKWFFAVKANFDNEGNLVCSFIEPVHFWSLQSVLSFV